MASGLFKLDTQDLVKGLVVAVFASVITYFTNPTLDFATIDWGYIAHVALASAVGYLGKNLITDNNGKILGSGL